MPLPTEQVQRRASMLLDAMGPCTTYLRDPRLVELMVNADGAVWVERLGAPMERVDELSVDQREQVIRLMADHAGVECREDKPSLSAILPSGERFQGFLPPATDAAAFCIRRPAVEVFTLEDYITQGVCTTAQVAALHQAVLARQNVLIAGGAGSGKTTLANALLAYMVGTGHRIITLEDTRELQCLAPNRLALYTKPGVLTMQRLVMDTLRIRPDRIVIGEIRDGAALDLLKAWGTGHPGGIATVHSNNAQQTLTRIEQLVLEVSATPQRQLIAEAINLVVYIERSGGGRVVESVSQVKGVTGDTYLLEAIA